MSGRGLRRFVEDLLGHRRPRSYDADPEDAGTLRAAITLRAARPGADQPSEEFVERLHQRLLEAHRADAAAPGTPTTAMDGPGTAWADADQAEVRVAAGPPPGPWAPRDGTPEEWDTPRSQAAAGPGRPGPTERAGRGRGRDTRRRFVQVTSIAAGSAAVAIAVDRAVGDGGGGADTTVAGDGGTLVPDAGIWRTVATTLDLPEGGVRAFSTGSVAGFVRRVDGRVSGTSGVCTHQGCHLALDPAQRQLTCPCHRTVFALTGEVVHSKLSTPPRTLPSLTIRELDGVIQVFVPPTPT